MSKRAAMHGDQHRTRMWRAMRMLRGFTVPDLEATAEVRNSHAAKYVRALVNGGYVRIRQAKRNGTAGGHAVYQLVRNTGPLPPRIGKHGVQDPNLDPAPQPGEDCVSVKRVDWERAMLCVRACAGLTDDEIRIKAAAR